MNDYYAILAVPEDAKPQAIRAAYRRLAKRCHPDLHPGDAASARQFIEAAEAYGVLSDKRARAAYDDARRPKAAERFAGSQQAHLYRENPYANLRAHYGTGRRHGAFDWQLLALNVATSPLTYCGLAVVLMLAGLKEWVAGLHPANH